MNIFIISLTTAIKRREFQKEQLSKLNVSFKFIDAFSTEDISAITYEKHYHDWQRPLRKTEVACYFSHQNVWNKIIQTNQPALILEDDVLLSKFVPELLKDLINKTGIDLINLENRSRKKFVSKKGSDIACNSKLFRLYQDRTGAAGYLLWPSGARKLLECAEQHGIALADAHISSCYRISAYQVEPAPIIQLDRCDYYRINKPYLEEISETSIGTSDKPKTNIHLQMKRILSQLKLAIHQILLIKKADRRYIKIRNIDFL